MTKRFLARCTAIFVSLLVVSSALAKPDTTGVSVLNAKSGASFTIPTRAFEVAPNVFSLGTTVVDDNVVEGIMFVHRKQNAKPDSPGGGKGGGGTTSACYSFIGKDARWKTPESWVLNPTNTQSLSDAFLLSATAANFQKWEDAAGVNIMGNGSLTTNPLVADTASTDGVNEIYFGEISDPGVIAVTIAWGVFGGPLPGREIVEMDQIFDQVDFTWNNNGSPTAMDYDNISVHELGHGLGMGHPSDGCTEETMYRFATEGETKKRDLNAGDIAGISALY